MGCGTAFRAAEPYRCKGCAKGAMTARVRWEGRRYQPCRLVWPPVLAANDLDGLGLVNLPECVHTHLHTARAASVCPCTDKNLSHSGQICAAIAGNAHWLQAFSLQLISCFQPIQQWAERGLSKGCTRSLGYTFAAVIGLGLLNLYLPLQQGWRHQRVQQEAQTPAAPPSTVNILCQRHIWCQGKMRRGIAWQLRRLHLPLAAERLSNTQLALCAEDIKRKDYSYCFVQSHAVGLLTS